MKKLATTLIVSALCATGCTGLQSTPIDAETHRIKVNSSTPTLDLAEIQNQLSTFVEIIELLNLTKYQNSIDNAENKSTALQAQPTVSPVPPKLEELITSINDNLEQLDNATDEAASIRQMLSMADQFSGNKQNMFSGLFDIIIKGTATTR